MSKDKYFLGIEEFSKETPAKNMMISALRELVPSKGNKSGFIFSVVVAALFSYIVGTSQETISMLYELSDKLLGIILAIFGCIFAVYSILLAFLNDSYIKKLCKINYDKNASYLKKSTTYYESVLFLYFMGIILNGLVVLLLSCMDEAFVLTSNHQINNILAITLIWVYLSFTFRIIYELKSTIYNTIVLFRASIAYKLIDFAMQDNTDD